MFFPPLLTLPTEISLPAIDVDDDCPSSSKRRRHCWTKPPTKAEWRGDKKRRHRGGGDMIPLLRSFKHPLCRISYAFFFLKVSAEPSTSSTLSWQLKWECECPSSAACSLINALLEFQEYPVHLLWFGNTEKMTKLEFAKPGNVGQHPPPSQSPQAAAAVAATKNVSSVHYILFWRAIIASLFPSSPSIFATLKDCGLEKLSRSPRYEFPTGCSWPHIVTKTNCVSVMNKAS